MNERIKAELNGKYDRLNLLYGKITNCEYYELRKSYLSDLNEVCEYIRGFLTGLLFAHEITSVEYSDYTDSLFTFRRDAITQTYKGVTDET